MAKGHVFDERGAKRIVESVRWTEAANHDQRGGRPRFVTSYGGGQIRCVVTAIADWLPNRKKYTVKTAKWDEIEQKFVDDPKGQEYQPVINEKEMTNTATLCRGYVVVGAGVVMNPIAVGEPVWIWTGPPQSNGEPQWFMDEPNTFGCGT